MILVDTNTPRMVVVGGVHGAGKSSYCREIAEASGWPCLTNQRVRGSHPNGAALPRQEVHALLREQVRIHFSAARSFVFEHVMSGHYVERLLDGARDDQFAVHLVYIDVRDSALALSRVEARLKDGGHDVEREKIAARLDESRANFWNLYRPRANSWALFDNSGQERRLIAQGFAGQKFAGQEHEALDRAGLDDFIERCRV